MVTTATSQNSGQPPYSLSVAVVGGGAAGLAAALELRRAGHRPVVYEQRNNIGGVWDYCEEVEDDPLGRGQRHVHGSMYAQLRTNLPREVMGFQSFPFDTEWPGSKDPRQFCEHAEVQRYLEAFAKEFQLLQHVRFGTVVQKLVPLSDAAAAAAPAAANSNSSSSSSSSAPPDWLRWRVTTQPAADGQAAASSSGAGSTSELFDAVVVCNGHYSRPRLPQLPGQDAFPGLQMHSHNYRRPDGFAGQTVLLVGASSSGVDIAEELAAAGAKQVILCARVWENPLTGEVVEAGSRTLASAASPTAAAAAGKGGNSAGGVPAGAVAALPAGIRKAANLAELHADGSVTLEDGTRVADVDCVMYCTGYHYSFPFLDEFVTVEDNRVGPLYQHVFPPAAAPTLSFVGLPWKVVPFPQFELQSRWIAQVLAGRAQLPSRQDMEAHTAQFYASLDAAGVPTRYTHRMSGALQWEYDRWLALQCGDAALPGFAWREALYNCCGMSRKLHGAGYRDARLPAAAEAEAEAREEAAQLRQQRAAALAAAAVR